MERVEKMFEYGAFVADPNGGCLPRNGDSDLCGRGFYADATAYFNRSDWKFVESHGTQGDAPAVTPIRGPTGSTVFPWAGQVSG